MVILPECRGAARVPSDRLPIHDAAQASQSPRLDLGNACDGQGQPGSDLPQRQPVNQPQDQDAPVAWRQVRQSTPGAPQQVGLNGTSLWTERVVLRDPQGGIELEELDATGLVLPAGKGDRALAGPTHSTRKRITSAQAVEDGSPNTVAGIGGEAHTARGIKSTRRVEQTEDPVADQLVQLDRRG